MTKLNETIVGEQLERQSNLKDQFLGMTTNEVDNWIDTNVNDLASAKLVLRRLGRILNAIAHTVDASHS